MEYWQKNRMATELTVDLGQRSYPIHIGSGVLSALLNDVKALQAEGRSVALLTDRNVVDSHFDFVQNLKSETSGGVVIKSLPPGEPTKSLSNVELVCDWLTESKIDRTGALFALGGGVIGDLAGYCAASYLRGIDFYQAPTTLLAMVDSSVGGKTGVNLKSGKNLVGAFYQPQAVYVDTGVLKTLPTREFSAGMAEIIKYGMLYDKKLFDQLMALDLLHPEHSELPGIIRRCCEIKAEIVKADERETQKSGGRALLNLGHTFAHGIENAAGYGEYLHGEAVGLGLLLAARLSQRFDWLSQADVDAVAELVERYQLPIHLRAPLKLSQLLDAMRLDKKVRHGKMRFVAMKALGQAVTVDDVSEEWVHELWHEVGAE